MTTAADPQVTTAPDLRAGMGGVPVPERPSVRRAEADDAPALARILALAFLDDPFSTYCVPRASTRRRRLEVGFHYQLRKLWLRHGTSCTTRERDGVAVWLPPGAVRPSRLEQIRMLPAAIANGRMEVRHFLRAMAALEEAHPAEPHFYLPMVGVLPDRQGRGIGHALLQPILDRCDREGVPAYLEATTERSIALYERNGFEVIDELHLPRGGPRGWLMWRRPAESRGTPGGGSR